MKVRAGWRNGRPGRSPAPAGESGSATAPMTAVIVVVMVLALLLADVGSYLAGRARAVAAADAAALAAAPVTFDAFAATGSPAAEAGRFAAMHGMAVTSCACEPDPSWAGRTVTVVVVGSVDLILFGSRRVSARASAEFDPVALVEDG